MDGPDGEAKAKVLKGLMGDVGGASGGREADELAVGTISRHLALDDGEQGREDILVAYFEHGLWHLCKCRFGHDFELETRAALTFSCVLTSSAAIVLTKSCSLSMCCVRLTGEPGMA
jgi:hypothetical protein